MIKDYGIHQAGLFYWLLHAIAAKLCPYYYKAMGRVHSIESAFCWIGFGGIMKISINLNSLAKQVLTHLQHNRLNWNDFE